MLPSLLKSRRLPATTVFFGSFLLFLIQPLTGRTLLPVFGGSASVWMVCLAVYQTLLLVGYGYAHLIARSDKNHSARYKKLHVYLLASSFLWILGIVCFRSLLKNYFGNSEDPTLEVLFCVLLFVGLPYILLSANSSLIQSWVSKGAQPQNPQKAQNEESDSCDSCHSDAKKPDVYRLYAISNFGSFCGLLIYPFILEPFVPLTWQWLGFALCLAGYVTLLAKLAKGTEVGGQRSEDAENERSTSNVQHLPVRRSFSEGGTSNEEKKQDNTAIRQCGSLEQSGNHSTNVESVSGNKAILWLILPAASSFLLNAITVYLSIDVTPMPFVWVALLSAFLLSYVIGFSPWALQLRWLWCLAAGITLIGAAYARGIWGTGSFFPNASAGIALLLIVGSILHGWLYEIRPGADKLTRYYLFISAGGAIGGLTSAFLAPLVFNQVWEYPLILSLCAALVTWRGLQRYRYRLPWACISMVAWLVLAHYKQRHTDSTLLYRSRNFYGCLAVTQTYYQDGARSPPLHYLWYGQTTHGIQLMVPDQQRVPTSYFGATGGGIAFNAHPKYQQGVPMKVGIVGLGAGTLATYGRPGDLFRFYEINSQVIDVATNNNLFTFLPITTATVDLVLGDARRMLERERASHQMNPKKDPLYDLLVIDAYNGDAVPYHLTTREAFQLYFDRIAPDGMLAVHISNWHIDLLPICKSVASDLGVCAYGSIGYSDSVITIGSIWVFMTRQPNSYQYPGRPERIKDVEWAKVRDIRTLTDERGSLMTLLR
jgi:spermidine synthase